MLLTAKEQLNTREGKPYFASASATAAARWAFPSGTIRPGPPIAATIGSPAAFYKVRAVYRETNYGPQLDIRKIREVVAADAADGFDPAMCLPQSRFEPRQMFDEMMAIARERIADGRLADVGRVDPLGQPRGIAADSGRSAQPSRLRRRLAGAYAERDPDRRLSGRQVRRVLSGDGPAAGQRLVVAGGDPARHRQAPRAGPAAGGHGLHRRGGADRPHAPGPRHRSRGGRGVRPSRRHCSCGWST